MKGCILIVDDDENIRNLLSIYLENEGFKTIKVDNAKNAIEIIEEKNIELVLLDIMMPQIDGIEACIKIRQNKKMPIIMISAKSEDMDKILGLNMGADDYLTKPFNPLELVARVKSQLRRYYRLNPKVKAQVIEEISNIVTIEDLEVNLDTHEIFIDGKEVKLTPTEFDILVLLAKNRGKVFSISNIYESVWNQEFMESDNTVMVHIRKIREKIESDPRKPRFIKTVWGVGYKIEK